MIGASFIARLLLLVIYTGIAIVVIALLLKGFQLAWEFLEHHFEGFTTWIKAKLPKRKPTKIGWKK